MGSRGVAPHGPAGERHGEYAAAPGRAHLQRGGRAALRDRLGHERRRYPGDDGAAAAFTGGPRHAARAAARDSGGVVPRLLAGDLRRWAPRTRSVHLCRRPQPRPRAAVRDPIDLRDCRDTQTGHRAVGGLHLDDGRDRPGGVATCDRASRRAPRRRHQPSLRHRRVRSQLCRRARGDPGLPPRGDGGLRTALGLRSGCARPARACLGVRARVLRSVDRVRALRRRGRARDSHRPARTRTAVAGRAAGGNRRCARRGLCAAHPRRSRACRADRAPRLVAALRLAAPRLRLDLDRRARGPARALAQSSSATRASRGLRLQCRVFRAWRSSRS